MKEDRKYYIKLDGKQLVEVTKEVYTVYRQMERKERYQEERDLEKGLIHYDSWDTKNINGQDYIRYTEESTEETVISNMRYKAIVSFINENDKKDILKLSLLGKTEKQIAAILGVSQVSINKSKTKLFLALKKYLNKNF